MRPFLASLCIVVLLGCGSDSTGPETIIQPDLDPITLSVVSVGATFVRLEWSKSTAPNFAAYQLRRSRLGMDFVAGIDERDVVTFRDGAVTPSTTYYYRLQVISDGGQAVRSTEVSATTLPE